MDEPYIEVRPPRALRDLVQRLWVHRVEGPPPEGGRRLLPDGRINVSRSSAGRSSRSV